MPQQPRLGVAYPHNELGGSPEALHRFATTVERLGYDHLSLFDHVIGAVPGPRDHPMPERVYTERDAFHDPLVAFGYIAAVTSRLELVTGVLILPQRQTVLVARQAADVDLLSGGRLRLGVGLGYNPVEYQVLGMDWRTRARRIAEQIPYLRQLWSGEPITFTGEFDRIDRAALNPAPTRPIPIWCGGSSEPALRRAAELADGFIFGYAMNEAADRSWLRLQDLLRAQGRPVEGFRAVFNLLGESTGSWLEPSLAAMPRLRAAGATDLVVTSARNGLGSLDEHLEFLAEIKARADEVLR
ncbi:MAG: LLM class F420-dependent oxidoreductase [Nocardioidaceae bacterium]